ncbi:MAG: hypothetical protein WAO58_02685 [Fimbriimonadaceae bacterium]
MNPVKLGAFLILGVLAFWIGLKIITGLVSGILGLLLPLAIVGGVGLILYGLISGGRPLGGGRRYLP